MPNQILFGFFQKVQVRLFGPTFRSIGQSLYRLGVKVAGDTQSNICLIPNPNKIGSENNFPDTSKVSFLAPNAHLSGSINIGKKSIIMFSSNLKALGSNSKIEIGSETSIGDLVTIKADNNQSVLIGDNCIISPNSYLHNCKIQSNSFVGANAKVNENCEIESQSGLAAGAYLLPGTKIKSREYWAGSPAKFLRNITEDEIEYLTDLKTQFILLGDVYHHEVHKSGATQIMEDEIKTFIISNPNGHFDEKYVIDQWYQLSKEMKMPVDENDIANNLPRMERQTYMKEFRYTHREMHYDGIKKGFPAYLNETNEGYKTANDLKNRLENDPETKQMKKEYFDLPKVNLNEAEFKRKF